MTYDEAVELLAYHSGSHPDIDHPKWRTGFLGMLRPYQGALIEANYREVIDCIMCVADRLQKDEAVDRRVVSSLWSICHLARLWGIDDDGMLRRNGLIKPADVALLERWVEAISYATMTLLDGSELEHALDEHRQISCRGAT